MVLSIDGQRVPSGRKMNALVYGSCVSRDLVEMIHGVECIEYIARQSWISAGNSGVGNVPPVELDSSFQKRMLEGDLASNGHGLLTANSCRADVILMDIVDDRFGVYPVGDGYVTPSAEFQSSGLRTMLDLGAHISFGTDRHFALWKESAERLWSTVSRAGQKTFLLGANFAAVSVDGTKVPHALGRDASDWNELYAPYYDFAKAIGFSVLELPDAFAVSTVHHKWNAAPFHYVEQAYAWWYENICRALHSTTR